MTKQTITIIIIALICLGLGYFVGSTTTGISQLSKSTFQDGWNAAKQRLAETGYAPIMEDMEITSIGGEVKNIQGNKISLKIYPLEPLADSKLDERIVQIDNNTKIYQSKQKDQAQYQKEMDEFNQRMQEQMNNPEAATEPVISPEPFAREEVSFSDIKIGMQITVIAQENIKDAKEFKAIEIILQFMPTAAETSGLTAPEPANTPLVE